MGWDRFLVDEAQDRGVAHNREGSGHDGTDGPMSLRDSGLCAAVIAWGTERMYRFRDPGVRMRTLREPSPWDGPTAQELRDPQPGGGQARSTPGCQHLPRRHGGVHDPRQLLARRAVERLDREPVRHRRVECRDGGRVGLLPQLACRHRLIQPPA